MAIDLRSTELKILKDEPERWNQWRKDYPDYEVNLQGKNLEGMNLEGMNLGSANLEGANLVRADLREANLIEVNFREANLEKAWLGDAHLKGADFSGANLNGVDFSYTTLSGAVIDSNTKLRGAKSITRGVNGIYSRGTKTAALMNMAPEGDSMQGSSVEAVLDNLKHARRLHSISLFFAGITLLSFVLHLEEITVPFNIIKKPIDPITFAGLSIIISATLMMFTSIFFGSALDGTKYLTSRDSAMKVGQFPWILSKYEKGIAPKIISILLRIILCFHPFIFIIVLSLQSTVADFERTPILLYLLFVSIPMLLISCFWLFHISIDFLRPIVFDVVEEAKRQSGEEKIASAIKAQTEKIDELLKFLQEREVGQRGGK
jgi:uncharacterized protein YjbI with pentapeptide repeats